MNDVAGTVRRRQHGYLTRLKSSWTKCGMLDVETRACRQKIEYFSVYLYFIFLIGAAINRACLVIQAYARSAGEPE